MKPPRGQAGFTLIELMVALAISSIMVLMVLGMFSRMSSAYRSQQQVTQLQVTLAAAQNMIEQDVKRAGFQLADGFRIADSADLLAPVQIVNESNGPDQLYLFSADASKQARVQAASALSQDDRVTVDDSTGFAVGELAVLVNSDTVVITGVQQASAGATADTTIPRFVACVVLITRVDPTEIRFETNAPWGTNNNLNGGHCDAVRQAHNAETNRDTMMYGFSARGYRVDPGRPTLGVLQVSPSGGLVADDWQDLGLGFTDLQLAARVFEAQDLTDTADPDALPQYDWYSGEAMETLTGTDFTAAADHPRITQLTVSLTARTDRDVDDIYTRYTPAFIDTSRADNNDLGDHDAVDLQAGTPPLPLRGNRIYRYSTNRVDLRNTGTGL